MATLKKEFDKADMELADSARALGHPARLAILRVLADRGTCICGDVVEVLPLAQSTVSQHLRVLKDAGLIDGTVEGPRSCYCLNPARLRALATALEEFFGRVDSTGC